MAMNNKSKPNGKPKGNTRNPKNQRSKPCPKATGNHPSWYTKEGVPLVGANFSALQSLAPEHITGLITEAIMHYDVAIVPPVDADNSFWQKMAEFYTEIREGNAGAANYSTGVLAAYALNIIDIYAIFYDLCKKLKATAETDKNAQLSAAIRSVAAGNYSYRTMAANFANRFNDLTMLAKEIEVLPILPFSAMERLEFYFGRIFKDSNGPKPAYIDFCPNQIAWFKAVYDKAQDNTTLTTQSFFFGHSSDATSWQAEIDAAYDILDYITGDQTMTILRGDIRKAFGNASMRHGVLVPYVSTAMPDPALDADVMSKLENASLCERVASSNSADFLVSINGNTGATSVTLPLAGVVDPKFNSRADKDAVLINWHKEDAPTAAELCSITRMMTLATQKNTSLNRSTWEVNSSDGLVITRMLNIWNADMTSVSVNNLTEDVRKAQGGDVDSFRVMSNTLSTVDHSPMVFTVKSDVTMTGREYIWDVDNFAVLERSTLSAITTRVIRSMYDVHVPRGPEGRAEKKP